MKVIGLTFEVVEKGVDVGLGSLTAPVIICKSRYCIAWAFTARRGAILVWNGLASYVNIAVANYSTADCGPNSVPCESATAQEVVLVLFRARIK